MEIANGYPSSNASDTARARRAVDAANATRTAANASTDRKVDEKAERTPPQDRPNQLPVADGPRGRQLDIAV